MGFRLRWLVLLAFAAALACTRPNPDRLSCPLPPCGATGSDGNDLAIGTVEPGASDGGIDAAMPPSRTHDMASVARDLAAPISCAPPACATSSGCLAPGSCAAPLVCMAGVLQPSCGDSVCDCGETPSSCPRDCGCANGGCLVSGVCWPRNACEPGASGSVCQNGAFGASCGDQICDCGETRDSCPQDCSAACKPGTCAYRNDCVTVGGCEPGNIGQWCQAGAFASSCGNGRCDCGETNASCPIDCP